MPLNMVPKIWEHRKDFQFRDIREFRARLTVLRTMIAKILVTKAGQFSLLGAAEFLGPSSHTY